MASPSGTLATQRQDLADSLREFEYEANRQQFIGHRVFPVKDVAVQAGTFGRLPVEELLLQRETRRAPGSGYNRDQMKFTTDSFATEEHGTEQVVDDREAKMYASYLEAEQEATSTAQHTVLVAAEQRISDLVFNTTTWPTAGGTFGAAPGTAWDTHATATPLDDVENGVRKVWENCGLWANALIISRLTFRHLRRCTEIIDAIASAGAGSQTRAEDITTAQLAAVFDLPHILVAGGTTNTAAPGAAANIASVWPKHAMIARVVTTSNVREPGLGRVFHFSMDGSQADGTVESYREEPVRGEVVRVRHDVDEKLLYKECGFLIHDATAA